MNEKDFDRILKADNSLHDAIRHREEKRTPMPEGLNDRLMQRIEKEVPARPAKTRRLIWPWIAAACVAAIMVVLLMPPRMSQEGTLDERRITKNERRITKDERRRTKDERRRTNNEGRITKNERRSTKDERRITKNEGRITKDERRIQNSSSLTGEDRGGANSQLTTVPDSEETKELLPLPQAQPKPEPRMLTERDIPITRPENYHYTPEEIALMKKQANEAYLKWVELELEIAKHNLEQMAQQ